MLLVNFYGNTSSFFDEAFYNSYTDLFEPDVLSISSTEIVLENPSSGFQTTFSGSGFPLDPENQPLTGTITSFSVVTDGSVSGLPVVEFTGISWALADFVTALDSLFEDDNDAPLKTLLSSQDITIDATTANAAWIDSLDGVTSNVEFLGSAFDDETGGGSGNDRLIGNAGADTLDGGDGRDTLSGGDGDDFIFGGATAADRGDVIYGGAGHDSVDGGYGNDELNGGTGNDTMEGNYGADTLIGNDGDDFLTGSVYSDLIFGGDGLDFINGGFGNDRVNGGADADRFYHTGIAGHGSDWIQDFSSAEGDLLQYGGAGATRNQFQVNFAETPAGTEADEAFVIYRPTGQILWALVDGAAQDSINILINGQSYDLLA
ncbi:hypothetical protein CKO11_03455 [Rhodobacter sp. TJ_12]|uniref:calcium-binding protein n=1 Tax=Rhodobacter sp. TJ_12 TaxID=2029399 RepID=UPI001CBE598C|nr:calcium-binding protein [Rhodobacter sp. TJ_12]MBZ4021513.1 hypothetical protein [Rhodobacter sp. TJ_12]